MSSASESAFLDEVEKRYGVKVNRQFHLGYWFYDAQFGKTLLEIDGSRWHSRPKHRRRDKQKDATALKYGFKLYRIKLDRVRDVQRVLEENHQLLSEIFNASSQLPLPPTEQPARGIL